MFLVIAGIKQIPDVVIVCDDVVSLAMVCVIDQRLIEPEGNRLLRLGRCCAINHRCHFANISGNAFLDKYSNG